MDQNQNTKKKGMTQVIRSRLLFLLRFLFTDTFTYFDLDTSVIRLKKVMEDNIYVSLFTVIQTLNTDDNMDFVLRSILILNLLYSPSSPVLNYSCPPYKTLRLFTLLFLEWRRSTLFSSAFNRFLMKKIYPRSSPFIESLFLLFLHNTY